MRPLFPIILIASFTALSAYAEEKTSAERLDAIAQRGAKVMPFNMEQTTHVFSKTPTGGIQQVIVKDEANSRQLRLVREHLSKISREFSQRDFSNPEKIHGYTMPGLAEMRQAGAGQITVNYTELPNGAQIAYTSELPDLVDAIHRWFDAQLSDHCRHAIPGHESHHEHGN